MANEQERDAAVLMFLPVIRRMAAAMTKDETLRDDLESCATLELMTAYTFFQPSRGRCFSDFARRVARSAMAHFFHEMGGPVSVCRAVDPPKAVSGYDFSAEPSDAPTPAESAETNEEAALVREMVDGLPERQRDLLRLRFGLDGGPERTLAGAGAELGLSAQRAQQLEQDALRALCPESRHRRTAERRAASFAA